MITDKLLTFCAGQSLSGASATASTDILDLGADRDFTALGQPLYVVVVLTASGGTSPTLAFNLQTDDNSSFSSAVNIAAYPATAQAVGQTIVMPFPHTNERYLRLSFTQAGTSPTATVSAYVTSNPQTWTALPDAL